MRWLFHKQALDPQQHWKCSCWKPGALSCSWAAELPLLEEKGSKQLLSSASGQGSGCEGCLLLPVSHETLSFSLKGGGGKAKGCWMCCGGRMGSWAMKTSPDYAGTRCPSHPSFYITSPKLPFTLMLTQMMKLINCWFAIVPDMPEQDLNTAHSVPSSLLLHHPRAERWGMEMPGLGLPVMSFFLPL